MNAQDTQPNVGISVHWQVMPQKAEPLVLYHLSVGQVAKAQGGLETHLHL